MKPDAAFEQLLSICIDPRSAETLQRQVYLELRRKILDGRVAPGGRIPATRVLSARIGVSRNTVNEAVSQLVAEGFLESRTGAGTFVCDNILALHSENVPELAAIEEARAPTLSRRGRTLEMHGSHTWKSRTFMPGMPAVDEFPFESWAKCTGYVSKTSREAIVGFADPRGHHELRKAVGTYLRTSRHVKCHDDQIFITAGALDGIDLVARALLDAGDEAVIEEPGYLGLKNILRAAGIKLLPRRVDQDGLMSAPAEQANAKLICVTPSHQFPLGARMGIGRRMKILEEAAKLGAWVLEDDYDSEFRHVGSPIPSLQGMDGAGRVLYLGTFSKVLFPSLRLGYLVVPEALISAFRHVRNALGSRASITSQAVLADFMNRGHFARHVRRMRRLYAERRIEMIDVLEKHASHKLDVHQDECGLHLVATLKPFSVSTDGEISSIADQRNLTLVPLSSFYETSHSVSGFLLGFASLSSAEIERGVRDMISTIELADKLRGSV